MSNKEPTNQQIRDTISEWWTTQFNNWGGDSLNEAVMDLATEDTEEAEERVYDKATTLLKGASVLIVWLR